MAAAGAHPAAQDRPAADASAQAGSRAAEGDGPADEATAFDTSRLPTSAIARNLTTEGVRLGSASCACGEECAHGPAPLPTSTCARSLTAEEGERAVASGRDTAPARRAVRLSARAEEGRTAEGDRSVTQAVDAGPQAAAIPDFISSGAAECHAACGGRVCRGWARRGAPTGHTAGHHNRSAASATHVVYDDGGEDVSDEGGRVQRIQ